MKLLFINKDERDQLMYLQTFSRLPFYYPLYHSKLMVLVDGGNQIVPVFLGDGGVGVGVREDELVLVVVESILRIGMQLEEIICDGVVIDRAKILDFLPLRTKQILLPLSREQVVSKSFVNGPLVFFSLLLLVHLPVEANHLEDFLLQKLDKFSIASHHCLVMPSHFCALAFLFVLLEDIQDFQKNLQILQLNLFVPRCQVSCPK